MKNATFELLRTANINDRTDKKNNGSVDLTYLSWSDAVDIMTRFCPDWSYKIKEWDGKPYLYDENLGYMVQTEITIEGETKTMWLPVMNSTNKAMKAQPYTYKTKAGDRTVEAATMFDINTTIMRCLVKNMAMFGLGLYIYSGEDIPDDGNKPTVEEICAKMDAMTLDNMMAFYARAMALYQKSTPEYKVWIKAWEAKKEALNSEKVASSLKSESDFLKSI